MKTAVCETCGSVLDAGVCWRCRAHVAEGRLQSLSVWGADEWMLKLAQLEVAPSGEEQSQESRLASRLHPIGMGGEFKSGGVVWYEVTPQIPLRPEILTVAPECAYGVLIDLKVGNRSQCVSSDPIPLSLFSPQNWNSIETMHAIMGRMAFDTVAVGQAVRIYVDLTPLPDEPLVQEAWAHLGHPVPTHFRCALWGKSVELDKAANITLPSPMFGVPPSAFTEDPVHKLALEAIQAAPEFKRIVAQLRRRLKKKG